MNKNQKFIINAETNISEERKQNSSEYALGVLYGVTDSLVDDIQSVLTEELGRYFPNDVKFTMDIKINIE